MRTAGIAPDTLAVLKKVAATSLKDHYYLAGGTACALHFGHRLSHDLDFFSLDPIDPQQLLVLLKPLGQLRTTQNEPGTFNGMLDEVKISFFIYPYPLIDKTIEYESAQIASIKDLACMKLEVVSSRGSKRDFIDLYQISQQYPLSQQLEWFKQKYQNTNISTTHIIKSLSYFDDAQDEPMPTMNIDLEWKAVKQYFIDEVKQISHQWGL